MINKTFSLKVITPEKVIYSKDVASIIAYGSEGYLGVLPQHAPLITTLKPGSFEITEANETRIAFSLNGGFMEVRENKVVILTDTAGEKQVIN